RTAAGAVTVTPDRGLLPEPQRSSPSVLLLDAPGGQPPEHLAAAAGVGLLEAPGGRPAGAGIPAGRPAERRHGQPHRPVTRAVHHEGLLAALRMPAQRAVRPARPAALLHRPHHPA